MKVIPCEFVTGAYKVSVDSDELQCDVRKLPYPATLGLVYPAKYGNQAVSVWTPAASVPRGYRAAAQEVLLSVWEQLQEGAK